MSSCFGFRKSRGGGETEPLLPRYEANTDLQRRTREKLHTFQMLQALSSGYMPTTDQLVSNLRTLLISDFLNPDNPTLSTAGRQLARDCRLWIRLFIEVLHEKNEGDQLQEAIWNLWKARGSLDIARAASQASRSKAQADASAAYESVRTVGSLLLTNAHFRLLIHDLATVGRLVFADTAASLSSAAEEVSKKVEPSDSQKAEIREGSSQDAAKPSTEELRGEAEQIAGASREVIAHTGQDALKSAKENVSGEQRKTLIYQLQQTVQNLRKRSDYSESVSTIAQLIHRYGIIYSRATTGAASTFQEETGANLEFTNGVQSMWNFLGSFGARSEWQKLEQRFHDMMSHSEQDPEFETLMSDIGNSIYKMLTEPEFFDSVDETMEHLKQKSNDAGAGTSLRHDVDEFLKQLKRTIRSISEDKSVSKLVVSSKKIWNDIATAYRLKETTLTADALHIFLPLLIRSIQHIPIPRLEISVPEMDLLLENVVLEPGHTIHSSSFLPYRILISNRNDVELRKSHSKEAVTDMKSLVTVSMNGLSVSAHDFGYWVRVHSAPWIPFFGDEGIASFALDQRGIDISLDFEIGRARLEQILTLRGVRVQIYKLDYEVRKGTWSFMWWVLKPFLKHMIRRILEKKIAEQIVGAVHVVNRELIFARERLRATRVADPDSLLTFVRAVLARLSPKMDPDVYTRVGIDAHRKGVFKGVYTPASITKIWHEEGERALEAVEEGEETGAGLGMTWQNDIFNVPTTSRRRSRHPSGRGYV